MSDQNDARLLPEVVQELGLKVANLQVELAVTRARLKEALEPPTEKEPAGKPASNRPEPEPEW